jgi:hypothetical protein
VLLGYRPGDAPELDLAHEPFACTLRDPYETTLIVRAAVAERMPAPATRLDRRRVILLEGQLDDELVGFMAVVTATLAERGIWLLALGAATRDHLLVAEDQLEDALGALEQLAGRNTPGP